MFNIARFIKIVLSLPIVYFLLIFIFSNIRYQGKSVMDLSTRNPVKAGEFGYTYQRFREIEHYKNIDMLFIGSSHAYRTFDTRMYDAYSLNTFNMGSPNQTPLNSYYLLKRYIDQLKPEWVVLELYVGVIDRSGLESFYDLAMNVPFCDELAEMAIAIESPHAINKIATKWLENTIGFESDIKQSEIKGEAYISGGYVEHSKYNQRNIAVTVENLPNKADDDNEDQHEMLLLDIQLEYIEKIIRLTKEKQVKILLVTQPLSHTYLKHVSNYEALSDQLTNLAEKNGVEYIDFNLDDVEDRDHYFADVDHLNPLGVEIFNKTLIEALIERNIIKTEMPVVKNSETSSFAN